MKRIIYILISAAVIVFLAGCPSGTYTVGDILEFTVDSDAAELDADGVLDFGVVKAAGGSETVSLTVTNTGTEEISVTSITVSDTVNYSLDLPSLPGVVAPGETTQYSLTFTPTGSGDLPATVSITAQDFTDTAEMDATGEGNYPPVPLFGVTVSGAGTAGANGFYVRDGVYTNALETTRPLYTKAGSPNYHIYIYDTGEGEAWCIDNGLDAEGDGDPLYYSGGIANFPPIDSGYWSSMDGSSPEPSLTLHEMVYDDYWVGITLSAGYLYSDEEGDLEAAGSAAYQWYRGNSMSGPFTPISGASEDTYTTVDDDDDGKFITVGVTLTAASGYTAGEEVLSDATLEDFYLD